MIPSRKLSALVLGGSGFIGHHLVDELTARHELFADVQAAGRIRDGRIITIDLLEECREPDIVYWAAGSASVAASLHDPKHDYSLNIPPLQAVLEQLESRWQRTRLVFLSSAAVYGLTGSNATPTSSALQPISPYGKHKMLSEQMIQASSAGQNGRCHIVRPFSVYGPGLKRQLFWDALEKIRLKNFDFFGSGQEFRDWVYVDDLVKLMADIAIFPERFATTLNAGSGRGISVESTLGQLFEALHLEEKPKFSGLAKAGDPDQLVADADEQQQFSDYFKTPLETGLRHYVAWYSGIHQP